MRHECVFYHPNLPKRHLLSVFGEHITPGVPHEYHMNHDDTHDYIIIDDTHNLYSNIIMGEVYILEVKYQGVNCRGVNCRGTVMMLGEYLTYLIKKIKTPVSGEAKCDFEKCYILG